VGSRQGFEAGESGRLQEADAERGGMIKSSAALKSARSHRAYRLVSDSHFTRSGLCALRCVEAQPTADGPICDSRRLVLRSSFAVYRRSRSDNMVSSVPATPLRSTGAGNAKALFPPFASILPPSSCSPARRLASRLRRLAPIASRNTQSTLSKTAKEGRIREFVEITGASSVSLPSFPRGYVAD
jgi:hypothetical protein